MAAPANRIEPGPQLFRQCQRGVMSRIHFLAILLFLSAMATHKPVHAGEATPLVIGQSFTIESKILGETRRINIYASHPYGESEDTPLPVLYMPDGGIAGDGDAAGESGKVPAELV